MPAGEHVAVIWGQGKCAEDRGLHLVGSTPIRGPDAKPRCKPSIYQKSRISEWRKLVWDEICREFASSEATFCQVGWCTHKEALMIERLCDLDRNQRVEVEAIVRMKQRRRFQRGCEVHFCLFTDLISKRAVKSLSKSFSG